MDKTELVNKLNEMRGSDHISEKYRLMLLNEYKEYCNKDDHTELIVFIEECAELIQCITKILRGRMKPNDISICEEIADVNICIDQVACCYGVDHVIKSDSTYYDLTHNSNPMNTTLFYMENRLIEMMRSLDELLYAYQDNGPDSYYDINKWILTFLDRAHEIKTTINTYNDVAGINEDDILYIEDIKFLRCKERREKSEPM